MQNKVFNTTFENMLRVLLLLETVSAPVNLHGDNEFGFAEFTNKREKITEAIKLSVKNSFVNVEYTNQGFLYSINDRGRQVVQGVQSPYARQYVLGAKIVCRRFSSYTDDGILQFISDRATEAKEV